MKKTIYQRCNVTVLQEPPAQDLGDSLAPPTNQPEIRHNEERDQQRGKVKRRSQPGWCL